MKQYQKSKTLSDEEIDLKKIILNLWKEKFLLIIIILIFSITGYIYGAIKPKVYQLKVTTRDIPTLSFAKFEVSLEILNDQYSNSDIKNIKKKIDLPLIFEKEFNQNLLSLDNMVNFFEQNKKIDKFKSYLKTNNINIKNYFNDKFKLAIPDKINDKLNKYLFNYTDNFSQQISAHEFLQDYVIYTKRISEKKISEQLSEIILNNIEYYNQNFNIAKKINLEYPILTTIEGTKVVNEPDALFYKGTKVLSEQILNLEKLLDQIKDFNLKYSPIAEIDLSVYLVSKSVFKFAINGLMIGIFLFIMIVYIRSILQKKL